jgi:hypothetical protein
MSIWSELRSGWINQKKGRIMSRFISTAVAAAKRSTHTPEQIKVRETALASRNAKPTQEFLLSDALYAEAVRKNITIESKESFRNSIEFACSPYKHLVKETNKDSEKWEQLVRAVSEIVFSKDNIDLKELPTRGEGWGELKGDHYVSWQPVLKPQLSDTCSKALKSFVDNKEVKMAAAVANKNNELLF